MIDASPAYMTTMDFAHRQFPKPRRDQRAGLGRPVPELQNHSDIQHDLCIGCHCATLPVRTAPPMHRALYRRGVGKQIHGMGVHVPRIMEEECVGCNLCAARLPRGQLHHDEADRYGPAFESWNMRAKRLAGGPGPGWHRNRSHVLPVLN